MGASDLHEIRAAAVGRERPGFVATWRPGDLALKQVWEYAARSWFLTQRRKDAGAQRTANGKGLDHERHEKKGFVSREAAKGNGARVCESQRVRQHGLPWDPRSSPIG